MATPIDMSPGAFYQRNQSRYGQMTEECQGFAAEIGNIFGVGCYTAPELCLDVMRAAAIPTASIYIGIRRSFWACMARYTIFGALSGIVASVAFRDRNPNNCIVGGLASSIVGGGLLGMGLSRGLGPLNSRSTFIIVALAQVAAMTSIDLFIRVQLEQSGA